MSAQAAQNKKFQKGQSSSTKEDPPAGAYVAWLHTLAPYRSPLDLHHRLGSNSHDAAGGTHQHRGGDNSIGLFDGTHVISGDLATDAGQRQAIRQMAVLFALLGATNSTTN